MKNFDCGRQLGEEDIAAWISRFDRDVDGGLTFGDLVSALQTMTNYVRKDGVTSPSKQKLTGMPSANSSFAQSARPRSEKNLAN